MESGGGLGRAAAPDRATMALMVRAAAYRRRWMLGLTTLRGGGAGRLGVQPRPEVLAEARRLFYVAFTRARRYAFLIYATGYRNRGGYAVTLGPSRFVEEVRRRLAEVEAWQLQKRCRHPHAKLSVCLHRDDVGPTNNSSERDLRTSVIHDRVTGGYRSRHGAEQGAIFGTLPTTARTWGQNAYEGLCSMAGPSPLLAAGLAR